MMSPSSSGSLVLPTTSSQVNGSPLSGRVDVLNNSAAIYSGGLMDVNATSCALMQPLDAPHTPNIFYTLAAT